MMKTAFWAALATILLAVPLAAADNVIHRGVDLWNTTDNGSTYMDFARNPIPGGFFCDQSEPFTGRIALTGVPVASGVRGELGSADTVVERLDNAVFNKNGVAITRIRVRALQLESLAPVKTACGSFKVRVVLEGKQPITRMRIVRENKYGGRFLAPIAIESKLVFIPISGPVNKILEISHGVNFPGNPRVPWTFRPGSRGLEKKGPILIDTNFDAQPDTFVPGTSNFAGGWYGARNKESLDCHVDIPEDHTHCVNPVDQ